jgi:Ca2+-binding RTX toxin-like protein
MTIEQDREQLMLELINRARLDPAGEAQRFGLADLSAGTGTTITTAAKQVLAYNALLYNSATAHNQYLVNNNVFSHSGSGGTTPSQRIAATGYTATGVQGYGTGENLAYIPFNGVFDGTTATLDAHKELFLSAGHRRNILKTEYKELGTSVIVDSDNGPAVNTTNNFGYTITQPSSNPAPGIVTGVHYTDTNNDDFYSVGESAAGRTVRVFSGSTVVGTGTTAAAGGYQVQPSAKGVVEVVFSNGGLTVENGVLLDLGANNVKVDLTDSNTIETNVTAVLSRGALNLTLLSIDNINGMGNELANTLRGNKANNILDGGLGVDTFFGGAGYDVVTYKNAVQAVSINLSDASGASNAGDARGERFFEIEEFRLSTLNDEFIGTNLNDIVRAGPGGDALTGNGGADTLLGDGAVMMTENALSIARLYLATLGRGPDDAGLTGWTAARDAGASLNSIATGFVNSAEFQAKYGARTNAQFVELLYNNVLHRAADSSGAAYWLGLLNGGATRESVVTGFSESQEFAKASDAEWHAGEVYRLYGATLDRAPDAEGFAGWVSTLDDGVGIQDVAAGFVNSPEFQSKYGNLDDTGFVTLLYNNVLGRAPDAGGLADWLRLLDSGGSRTAVVVGFSDSPEYVGSTAADLKAYMKSVQPTWNDTLNGGAGNDYVSGGHGADSFVFNRAALGADHIFEFEAWDSVRLEGFGYGNTADVFSHLSVSGANVIFTDQGQTITFHTATLAEVQAADWILV